MHLPQMLPQMVLAIEPMFASSSTPATRTIEFVRGEMGFNVTVEIVLALCLVVAGGVETSELLVAGRGGGSGFAGALCGGIDGGGVGDVYMGMGVCCGRRDGLGVVVIFVRGGG